MIILSNINDGTSGNKDPNKRQFIVDEPLFI